MPQVVIVSPALRAANNGNWQTARRWQGHLTGAFRVRISNQWPDAQAADDQVMIALHARRSADAIAAWRLQRPAGGLAVVLTGTDLYRDIKSDASAQHSLAMADRLVVLQDCAPESLPAQYHSKTSVIFQSTAARRVLAKSSSRLRVVMVGHLREEKSPETLFAAAHLLASRRDVRIDHVGEALDPALAAVARETMRAVPNYRWLGGLPHEAVRRRIQRAHVLVHASRLEGGAHVVMEAVTSGTPVLASAVAGNVGMLGADYAGYFPWGDVPALVALILRCRSGELLPLLGAQCRVRAPLFDPATERAAIRQLVEELLDIR